MHAAQPCCAKQFTIYKDQDTCSFQSLQYFTHTWLPQQQTLPFL